VASVRSSTSRLTLIGGFALRRDGREVPLTSTVQRVVALLALAGRPQRRASVATALWPDADEEQGRSAVRSTLWRLRRNDPSAVVATSDGIALDPAISIDIREAEATIKEILAGGRPDEVPPSLFDDVLPEWPDEWLVVERERYRQLRLHALELHADALTREARFAESLAITRSIIAVDPIRETAHRGFLRALLAEGNRGEAVRAFRSLRETLVAEVGVEPTFRLPDLEPARSD